jgi:hypothetical protein
VIRALFTAIYPSIIKTRTATPALSFLALNGGACRALGQASSASIIIQPIERCLAVFLGIKMRKTTLAILFFVVMICANCTWRTLPVQAGKEFEEGRAAYEL